MAELRVQVIASGATVHLLAENRADLVICADGGLDAAWAAGVRCDLVIGDLDSVSPAALHVAQLAGIEIVRHPVDKDESDLELALDAAVVRGGTQITVHLGAGGRLDHQLANLLVLASPRWTAATLDAWVGSDPVKVVRGTRPVGLPPGAPVAIFAVGGPACVTTHGLAFTLRDEVLEPTAARGIANEVTDPEATVTVTEGVVLVLGEATQEAQAT